MILLETVYESSIAPLSMLMSPTERPAGNPSAHFSLAYAKSGIYQKSGIHTTFDYSRAAGLITLGEAYR